MGKELCNMWSVDIKDTNTWPKADETKYLCWDHQCKCGIFSGLSIHCALEALKPSWKPHEWLKFIEVDNDYTSKI